MNAKEYLERIRLLDSQINRKLEQLSALRDVATKTTSILTSVPGSDHDPKSKETLMSRIVDIETEIDGMVDTLVDMKAEAIEMIYRLDNIDHCKLLENKYIKLQTWEEVAKSVGISPRSVYRVGCVALSKFEKIFEENMKLAVGCQGVVSMVSACSHD